MRVSANLCNFLGQCAKGYHTFIAVASPLLTISILGPAVRNVQSTKALVVRSELDTAVCSGDSALTTADVSVRWALYEDGVERRDLESTTTDPMRFTLPAHTLVAGTTYRLAVAVLNKAGEAGNTASVLLQVSGGDITALLDQPSMLNLDIDNTDGHGEVTFDASSSFDTAAPNDGSSGLDFAWSCVKLSPVFSDSCGTNNEARISSAHTNFHFSVSDLPSDDLDDARVTDVSFEYRVTMVVSESGSRHDSASTVVRLTKRNTPRLTLALESPFTMRNGVAFVNAANKIVLKCTVDKRSNTVGSDFQWLWDHALHGDLSSIAVSDTSVSDTTSLNDGAPVFLVLPSGALTSGRQYSFTFTNAPSIAYAGASYARASLTLLANAAPHSGGLRVSPSSGKMMVTVFRFFAAQWMDDDLPLEFEFRTASPTTADNQGMTLRARSESSRTASQLRATPGKSNVRCTVIVYDSLDASSSASKTIKLSGSVSGVSSLKQDLNDALDSAISTDQKRHVLVLYAPTLVEVECSKAPKCSKLDREHCSVVAHTCGPCLDGYYGQSGHANTKCGKSKDKKTLKKQQKSCPNDCSGRGKCRFIDVTSLQRVNTCGLLDSSCRAKCNCYNGRYGASCAMTKSTAQSTDEIRNKLTDTVRGLLQMGDTSDDDIVAASSTLNVLAGAADDLTDSDVGNLITLANTVVDAATSHAVPFEKLTPVLDTLDKILARVALNDTSVVDQSSDKLEVIPLTRRVRLQEGNEGLVVSSIAYELIEKSVRMVAASHIPGEPDVTFSGENYRACVTTYLYTGSTIDAILTPPSTTTETLLGLSRTAISFGIRPLGGVYHTTLGVYEISRSSLGVNELYQNPSLYRNALYLSNPVSVYFKEEPSSLTAVTANFVFAEEVSTSDLNVRPGELDVYKDMCFDEDPGEGEKISQFDHKCVATDTELQGQCQGKWGRIQTHCPETFAKPTCYAGHDWPMSSSDALDTPSSGRSSKKMECSTMQIPSSIQQGDVVRFVAMAAYENVLHSQTHKRLDEDRERPDEDILFVTASWTVSTFGALFLLSFAIDLWRSPRPAAEAHMAPSSVGRRGSVKVVVASFDDPSDDVPPEVEEGQGREDGQRVGNERNVTGKHEDAGFLPTAENEHVQIEGMQFSIKRLHSQVASPKREKVDFKSKKHINKLIEETLPSVFGPESLAYRIMVELGRHHRWFGEVMRSAKLHITSLCSKCITFFFVPALFMDAASMTLIKDDCEGRETHRKCLAYESFKTKAFEWDPKCFWDFKARECYFDYPRYYRDGFSVEDDLDDSVILAMISSLLLIPVFLYMDRIVLRVLNSYPFENSDDEMGTEGFREGGSRYTLTEDEVDTGLSAFDESRSIRSGLHQYIEMRNDNDTYVLSDQMRRAMRKVWGLDDRDDFAMPLSPSERLARQERGEEPEADPVGRDVQAAVESSLEVVKKEMVGHARFLAEKSKSVQGFRLLFLLQRDLLGPVPGQVMAAKFNRDFEYFDDDRVVPLDQWTFWATALLTVDAAMLFYLFAYWTPVFGFHQSQERQWNLVWCFALLVVMDAVVISTLEVLVTHVALPQSVYSRVRENFKHVRSAAYDYSSGTQKAANNDMDATDAPEFTTSKYFFVSSRIARRLPEVGEAAVVERFSRVLPSHNQLKYGAWFQMLSFFYSFPSFVQDLLTIYMITWLSFAMLLSLVVLAAVPGDGMIYCVILIVGTLILMVSLYMVLSTDEFVVGECIHERDVEKYGLLSPPQLPQPPETEEAQAQEADRDGAMSSGGGIAQDHMPLESLDDGKTGDGHWERSDSDEDGNGAHGGHDQAKAQEEAYAKSLVETISKPKIRKRRDGGFVLFGVRIF